MRRLLSKFILYYIYIPLLKLQFKLHAKRIKQINFLKGLTQTVLEYWLKYLDKDYIIQDNNKIQDNIVFAAVAELCELKFNEEDTLFAENYRKRIDEQKEVALKTEKTKELLSIFFKLRALINKELKKPDEADKFYSKAKEFQDIKEPFQLKDIVSLKKRLTSEYKFLKNEIIDRKAVKYEVKIVDLIAAASYISIIFIVSGYVSKRIFYSGFNIKVEHYFEVSDYLSASLSDLYSAIQSAIYGIIGLAIGIVEISRRSKREAEINRPNRNYLYVLVFISYAASIFAYFKNEENQYLSYYMSIYFTVIWFGESICMRFFKNILQALFLLIFTTVFFADIITSSYRSVYKIKNIKNEDQPQEKIIFNENYKELSTDFHLLGRSSNFYFLINKNGTKSIVVPKDAIKEIEIN